MNFQAPSHSPLNNRRSVPDHFHSSAQRKVGAYIYIYINLNKIITHNFFHPGLFGGHTQVEFRVCVITLWL